MRPLSANAGIAARLGFFYAAHFAVLGVQAPFLPLWLQARGLSEGEVGIVVGAAVLLRIPSPFIGRLADRRDARRGPLRLLALLSLGIVCLLSRAQGFWPVLAAFSAFSLAQAAILPLAESMLTLADRRGLARYGPVRTVGSVVFLLTALGVGSLLRGVGAEYVLDAMIVAVATVLVAALVMPEVRARASADTSVLPPAATLRALLADRTFRWFLLAAGSVMASHAVLHVAAPQHWKAAGVDTAGVGQLWAMGVGVEIALFAVGTQVLRRLGPLRLLAIAASAAIVRWSIAALTVDFAWLCAAQSLHGITYGAAHLAAMRFLGTAIPAQLTSSAQSLYTALGMGVLVGMASLGGGAIAEHSTPFAFAAMAGLGVIGLLATLALARRWRPGTELALSPP